MRFTWQRGILSLVGLSLLIWTACNSAPAPIALEPKTQANGTTTVAANNSKIGAHNLTLLDDKPAKLADYQGKVLVLDFWATYCPPCVAATPDLDALQKQYGAQGLQILGINVGGPDDRPEIPKFIAEHKISYTLAYPGQGMVDYYMGDDDRIPQTLVYDRQGNLVKHFVGYNNQVKQELENAIQTALKN